MTDWVAMAAGLVVLFIVFLILVQMIRIDKEYERIVVFRLGRCTGAQGPGLVLLIPVIDQPVWADLREQYLEVPRQTCITKDNAPISIDFLVYWKVTDPVQSVVQVQNFAGAVMGIATTTLRSVVGDLALDDVLAKREDINSVLRGKLDEVTARWGGKVTSVEIREIEPPTDVQEAMTKQMSAERTRRATVTSAEGDRQAAILRAEGFALALSKIFEVARTIDANTLSLQYLKTLESLGEGASTKFIFPMEFASFLKPMASAMSQATGAPESGIPKPTGGAVAPPLPEQGSR